MIYLIEGARNSGKTFLVNSLETDLNYKFDFTNWVGHLDIVNKKKEIHQFSLAKEIMLHDLNRNGFIEKIISDRGIFTVLTWAVLEGRVTEQECYSQLKNFVEKGLLKDTNIIYVEGNNPEKRQEKDFWSDDVKYKEKDILEKFIKVYEMDFHGSVRFFENRFDSDSIKRFKNIF